ncbi:hypothetical protein M3685_22010 [Heyndrickxia oleronia]|uniref:hypothetical protein n=1 Tax=Heyndrickxia oleronia TaxID=38875 RepID=UPI00203D99D9|nr:hypothetical protein [Heyndrickxia oleronia]MCM3456579.1 hypothetical protein [Heyndrickxia oleronia]
MISKVETRILSKEELEKVRTGAKCDLENRPRKKDWKWRSKEGGAARWGNR